MELLFKTYILKRTHLRNKCSGWSLYWMMDVIRASQSVWSPNDSMHVFFVFFYFYRFVFIHLLFNINGWKYFKEIQDPKILKIDSAMIPKKYSYSDIRVIYFHTLYVVLQCVSGVRTWVIPSCFSRQLYRSSSTRTPKPPKPRLYVY